eukprot:3404204-Rhodomonas_salina.1
MIARRADTLSPSSQHLLHHYHHHHHIIHLPGDSHHQRAGHGLGLGGETSHPSPSTLSQCSEPAPYQSFKCDAVFESIPCQVPPPPRPLPMPRVCHPLSNKTSSALWT